MSLDAFTDRAALEQIRRDLWIEREHGRASVMIGAGFSRNANPLRADAPPFPTWRELGVKLRRELDPLLDSGPESASANDVMRAGFEYEVQFGATRLAEFLLREIPDEHYEPGSLHRLLLSLPWSDIFTTNYDTLLERARRLVPERHYDVVIVPPDLAGRLQPRIVKLHGSFPSHRPFVFTEEDFRRYPRDFAPFVNLVQQALMETTLCLLGFSGDDPNFLAWSGWVRDELGHHAQPIYLCGLLNLSAAARIVLDRRNIRVVDVAPLFTGLSVNPRRRHSMAVEWLLRSLLAAAPMNRLRWPTGGRRSPEPASNDLPDLLPATVSEYTVGPIHPHHASDFED
jgi:hypothetical protein